MQTINSKNLEHLSHYKKLVEGGIIMKPNFSKLARELNVSRETARKYYNGHTKSNTRKRISKVSKHHDLLKSIFESNIIKVYYISQLLTYIKQKTNDCDYSRATLSRYINTHFSEHFKTKPKHYTMYETKPGVEAQCDFKERQQLITKSNKNLTVTTLVVQLSYSRKRYRRVLPNKSTETVLNALADIFKEIGGVPQFLKFDNDSVFVSVAKNQKNEKAILTSRCI